MGSKSELWQRCKREGTPLIEEGKAVFIWFGETSPYLVGDFNGWEAESAVELQPLEGEEAWFCELDLPEDAYMEYAFINTSQEREIDPFNLRKVPNGLGKANQFFYMPHAKPTPWMLRSFDTLHGELSQAVLEGGQFLASGKRTVHFYQPPGTEPAALVVVWDGGDYLRRARLVTIVENLAAAGRIRPLALAMVENGGPARTLEYACSEATIGFLLSSLIPQARRRLNLLDPDEHVGAYGVLGASLGGLMALYVGLRLPHLFGRVLAQSGAYEIEGYEFITSFMIEHGPRLPIKIWMDSGRYEGLLEANRMMHAKLTRYAYDVHYHEYNGGHNYSAWRDDLPKGLESLFNVNSIPTR